MRRVICSSTEHTSPYCRWLNIYRDPNGKYHCSSVGFESQKAAQQVGSEHGTTYVLSVPVPDGRE